VSLFNELKRRNVFKVGIAYVVVTWLVAQVLQLVFESFGTPDWVMKTVLVLMTAGLLFALFFAWAFEMTPEGLKREHEVDRSQSITLQTGKKLNNLIFAVMGLALVYFAYDKFFLSSERESAAIESALEEASFSAATEQVASDTETGKSDASIAVLPFADMSPNKDQDYFSDGLSEELLNLLAKIPELQVAARTSSFSFKDQTLEIKEIAERLQVGHVLEGSVRTAGDQIRITAQLIHAEDGYHMWSETYDRKLENVFAIQDEIAAEVVKQLKVTLLGEVPTVKKTDPKAYALFLRGRQLSRQFTAENIARANELYKQAIAIDPDYALAWVELGRNYTNQGTNNLIPLEQSRRLSMEAGNKALSIDPNLAPGFALKGWQAMTIDSDLATAARHFERAFEFDPSDSDIMRNVSHVSARIGRLNEAILLGEYLIGRDPLNTAAHYSLSYLYLLAGRLDDAQNSIDLVLSLSPERIGGQHLAGAILLLKGRAAEALTAFTSEVDEQYRIKGRAMALYSLGRQAEYEAARDELITDWGERWPDEVAQVYAWVGDSDSAFTWIDKALEVHGNIDTVRVDPFIMNLHDDPRWQPLLEKAGVSPEQLAAIEFNITLPGM
jgi:TolB-like protein